MVLPILPPREMEGGVISCDAQGPSEMTSVPFPLPVNHISEALRAFKTSTGRLEGLPQPVWEWGGLGGVSCTEGPPQPRVSAWLAGAMWWLKSVVLMMACGQASLRPIYHQGSVSLAPDGWCRAGAQAHVASEPTSLSMPCCPWALL